MERWLDLFRRTRREYFADFFITPPLTLGLLLLSLAQADGWWPLVFAAGLLSWTFYEYATHRWVAHGVRFFREAHALHHKVQRDYIALHPLVTLTIYGLFWALFGLGGGATLNGVNAGNGGAGARGEIWVISYGDTSSGGGVTSVFGVVGG